MTIKRYSEASSENFHFTSDIITAIDDQLPETTRNFETTTYGVYVKDPPVERLCKNCRFWERIEEYGLCQCLLNNFNHPILAGIHNGIESEFSLERCGSHFGCVHFEQREQQ